MNEYDYKNQAWVVDGKYARCGHSESMDCKCYGKLHEGEPKQNILKVMSREKYLMGDTSINEI